MNVFLFFITLVLIVLFIYQWKTTTKNIYKGIEEIEKQIARLTKRIDNLYSDKLDGNISEDYWREKHNLWYREKDELIEKMRRFNEAARTFDEGTNLLENFCKCTPELYLKACPKTKQQILKIVNSQVV